MMNRWHLIFLLVLLLGGPWLWLNRLPVVAQPDWRTPQPALGHPAPDFTLPTLDGQRFTLAEKRGTPVVLNFWATWCGPCQNEMPTLQTTFSRMGERVLIVGVDQGETTAEVQPFIDRLGLTFPIAMDSDMAVGNLYNIRGMPTTYFIDSDGIIRHIWVGEMNSVTLAEGISYILR